MIDSRVPIDVQITVCKSFGLDPRMVREIHIYPTDWEIVLMAYDSNGAVVVMDSDVIEFTIKGGWR